MSFGTSLHIIRPAIDDDFAGLAHANSGRGFRPMWQFKSLVSAPGTLSFFPAFLDRTGGRVSEMSKIQWMDVNGMDRPVEGHVTLTLRHTKGRKVRTITLRQEAIDILLQIPQSNRGSYVFRNSTEDCYCRCAALS
jgi:integrase